MSQRSCDAVVIGAGHHGLVSAALLADAGWDVIVLESRSQPGGAIASRTMDGFIVDEFSSCHPLGRVSPVLAALELESHGLSWVDRRPAVTHVSHSDDGEGTAVEATPEATAAALDADHPGDGDAWLRMFANWQQVKRPLLDALLLGWPPVRGGARLARTLGVPGLLDFARFALLPVEQLNREWFGGARARDIVAGNSAHADVSPLAPISGFMGFLLSMLAQDVGFPMPRGGASALAEAMAARASRAGAVIEFNSPVTGIEVTAGRATGVQLADGSTVAARRAVIADVAAPALYEELLPAASVPPGLRARISRFVWDHPTLKLNLLLDAPMPWRASKAHGAAVVHMGQSSDGFASWHTDIATGRVPERAFALVGQTTTADPTRSPAGTESLWAYTHLPRFEGAQAPDGAGRSLASVEHLFDDLAPGWRELERGRWVQTPQDLQDADANLVGGAVGAGTSQLFQQGPWRPVAGLGGPTTHLQGLFLASAATHPGGAVHGGAGFNAARAALRSANWWSRPLSRTATWAQLRLQRREPGF